MLVADTNEISLFYTNFHSTAKMIMLLNNPLFNFLLNISILTKYI